MPNVLILPDEFFELMAEEFKEREKEREYWGRLICELQEKFTLEYMAKEFNVTVRQVSNWKRGDRPLGITAVRVYLFHGKHRTVVQECSTAVHGAIGSTDILS